MSTPTLPPAALPRPAPLPPPPPRRSAGAWLLVGTGAVVAAALVGTGAHSLASVAMRHSAPGSADLTGVRAVEVRLSECAGDVAVTGDAAPGAATLAWEDLWSFARPDHAQSVQDGVLRVRVTCPRWTWGWTPSSDLTLSVPADARLTVDTGAGEIRARSVGGAAVLSSGTGDVIVEDASGDLTLSTGVGDVRASTSGPMVEAGSGTGDVTVTATAVPERVDASSGVGDVLVEVPDDPGGYALQVETGLGSARSSVSEQPASPRSIMAMSGVGDVTVRPAG